MRTLLALACAWLVGGCAFLQSREAVVFCQAADAGTTLYAIERDAREANPVADWLMKEFGPGGFVAAKVGVTLLFLHYYPEMPADLVAVLNGATCAVAAHNATVAAKLERKKPPGESEPPGD